MWKVVVFTTALPFTAVSYPYGYSDYTSTFVLSNPSKIIFDDVVTRKIDALKISHPNSRLGSIFTTPSGSDLKHVKSFPSKQIIFYDLDTRSREVVRNNPEVPFEWVLSFGKRLKTSPRICTNGIEAMMLTLEVLSVSSQRRDLLSIVKTSC